MIYTNLVLADVLYKSHITVQMHKILGGNRDEPILPTPTPNPTPEFIYQKTARDIDVPFYKTEKTKYRVIIRLTAHFKFLLRLEAAS